MARKKSRPTLAKPARREYSNAPRVLKAAAVEAPSETMAPLALSTPLPQAASIPAISGPSALFWAWYDIGADVMRGAMDCNTALLKEMFDASPVSLAMRYAVVSEARSA